MVHYNGFVFGANFSKIIIIREREARKENESDGESSSSSSSNSDADGSDKDEEVQVQVQNQDSIVREDSVGYQDLKNMSIANPVVVKQEPASDNEE